MKMLIKIFLTSHRVWIKFIHSNFLINFERKRGKLFCHLVSPRNNRVSRLHLISMEALWLLYHRLNNARKFKPLSFPEHYSRSVCIISIEYNVRAKELSVEKRKTQEYYNSSLELIDSVYTLIFPLKMISKIKKWFHKFNSLSKLVWIK